MTIRSGWKTLRHWARRGMAVALAATLAACGGGGGGGASSEASVQSASVTDAIEGASGQRTITLTVTLTKPLLVDAKVLQYSTAARGSGLGFATAGASCTAGVDYIATTGQLSLSAGVQVITVPLAIVCGDAVLEPTETFNLNWSLLGQSGTLAVSILNDDAGGLNGAGVATVLGGGPAFGRDTNALTNSAVDGARGFAFATTALGSCRSDLVTGLTWGEIDVSLFTQGALAAQVAAANLAVMCGFSDWRMPGVDELAGIVDNSQLSPGILNADATAALSSQMTGKFWSADGRVGTITDQMVVDFSSQGAVGDLLKTSTARLRLVRGAGLGDPCDPARFTDNGDGTVTDPRTALMWKQCPEGLSGAACAAGAAFDTGADPLAQVALVNASPATLGRGFGDWRIPSRNELASLVCRSAVAAPLINTTAFPATGAFSYLSSTLHPSGLPWFVNFDLDGSVGAGSIGGKRLRLVRAGQ